MGLVMNLAKKLYELQQIDLEIQKEQEALNEVSRQLGESEAVIKAKAELLAEENHLAEIEKQQRDVEWEIEDLRSNITQLNEKLYGGKVKSPKELVSLEKEAEIFKARLREKEDKLLDLMAETEAIQDKIKLDGERLKKLEREWKQEQKALTQKQAKVENRLSDLSRKRQAAASEIIPQTLELYEVIRLRKGQAVVKVEQGRCHGCHLTLSMNELQRARAGTLAQCSSCGRILYLG
jgi:predicted  nucleic acid-binding Zn-ribbon protein